MNNNNSESIPGMDTNDAYKKPEIKENPEQLKKEFEKTKKELEKLKTFILKKYKFVQAISILPPQAIKFFIDEEEVPKESEKSVHLNIIIPDEKAKEIDPSFTQSYISLGDLASLRGDIRSAAEYYQKTLELDPNHTATRAKLDKINSAP